MTTPYRVWHIRCGGCRVAFVARSMQCIERPGFHHAISLHGRYFHQCKLADRKFLCFAVQKNRLATPIALKIEIFKAGVSENRKLLKPPLGRCEHHGPLP